MFIDSKLNTAFNNNDVASFMVRLLSLTKSKTLKNTIEVRDSVVTDDCYEFAVGAINNHIAARSGKVYIANNLNHLDHIKIGRTYKDIKERESALNGEGVIGKIHILYWTPYIDCVMTETLVHRKLQGSRIEKEFFNIPYDVAVEVLTETETDVIQFYNGLLDNFSR